MMSKKCTFWNFEAEALRSESKSVISCILICGPKVELFRNFCVFSKIFLILQGCVCLCLLKFVFCKKEVPLPGFTLFVFCKTWWKKLSHRFCKSTRTLTRFSKKIWKNMFLETSLLSCGFVLKNTENSWNSTKSDSFYQKWLILAQIHSFF